MLFCITKLFAHLNASPSAPPARHPSAREMKFTQPEIKAKMKSDEKLNINCFWLLCCCSLLALARSTKLENWSRWRMTEAIYFDLFRMTCITSQRGYWHVLGGVWRRSWVIFWQLHSFRYAIRVDQNDKLCVSLFSLANVRHTKNAIQQKWSQSTMPFVLSFPLTLTVSISFSMKNHSQQSDQNTQKFCFYDY